jgi:low temperature requirement protein LtrA
VTSGDRGGAPPDAEAVTERTRVSSVELFFDLVYVFVIDHVHTVVAGNSEIGVVRGGLIFALLWWVWVGYAWLGNLVFADQRFMQVTLFAAVMIIFLIGAAIPDAFVNRPGSLNGPLVFVGCYLAARMLQAVALWHGSRRAVRSRRLLGVATPAVIASALLVCAALVPQQLFHDRRWIDAGQDGLWVLAIIAEYGAGVVVMRGWPVRSATLWGERHQLIVIVALGEAFIGLGLGGIEIPLSPVLIGTSVVGIVIIAALWWAYFEVLMPAGELALHRSSGAARAALARDAYSLLHLPIVAGIVLLSLGLEKTLGVAKHITEHSKAVALDRVSLGALYGGVILYLLGVLAFQRRVMGRVSRLRVAAAALLAALTPIGALVPALVAFGMLAVVAAGLVAAEFAPHTALHRELRHSLAADEQ